jgi:hypothetical protein
MAANEASALADWGPVGASFQSLMMEAHGDADFWKSQSDGVGRIRIALRSQFAEELELARSTCSAAANAMMTPDGGLCGDRLVVAKHARTIHETLKAIANKCEPNNRSDCLLCC